MAHHKRGRPKGSRGHKCFCCKPHKHQALKDCEASQTGQERRARVSEEEQLEEQGSFLQDLEDHYASELVNVVEIRPETRRFAVDFVIEEARVVIDGKLQPTLDEWYANEQKRMQGKATWNRCLRRWATKHASDGNN